MNLENSSDFQRPGDVASVSSATATTPRPVPHSEESGTASASESLPGLWVFRNDTSRQWPSRLTPLEALACIQGVIPNEALRALSRQVDAIIGEEQVEVQIASLYGLIILIGTHPDWNHPSIGLRDDGVLSASWSPERGAKLTLYFQSEGQASWVAADARNWPPSISSGKGKLAAVAREIGGADIGAWVRRER